MNNTSENKKNIFYITMLIITLLIVIIGVVYALTILVSSRDEGSSAIYTGTLVIDYEAGNKVECKLVPIYTPSSLNDPNAYTNTFSISSTGTLNSLVDIKLKVNENEFTRDWVKYALYHEDGELIQRGSIIGLNDVNLATGETINSGEKETYVLQIWLEENSENQNSEMRKNLSATIEVNATQSKKDLTP